MYGHRRERSSLSTNCSQSSGHSRVLPFATARTRAAGHMEAIAETPDTQMPIIGLGLTLNPADALVRIQSRRSIHSVKAESTRSSVVLSEAFSYASPALESCVSLADLSPRYTDPQFVHTRSVKRTHMQSEQMAKDSWQSSPEHSSPVSSRTLGSSPDSPDSPDKSNDKPKHTEPNDTYNSVEHASERCNVHPGSRHEHWCTECQTPLCTHCAAHHPHTIVTLTQAYDDAFDAIENMQISMVRHLTDTRKRTSTLDTQLVKLAQSYEEAHNELDTLTRNVAEDIDLKYYEDVENIQEHKSACAEWRESLEDTVHTVQQMVEELPPTQLVAKRDRVLALLGVVERTRPHTHSTQRESLVDMVRPPRHSMTFHVPRVLELGRKRGHVRVQHTQTVCGLSYHIEARRTRGPLGDPCLTVTLRTSASSSHVARVYLTESSNKHFVQERIVESQAEFVVCSLKELESLDVLDTNGGVTVHWDVRARSYKQLAHEQQLRIGELEQKMQELEEQNKALCAKSTRDVQFGNKRESPVLLLQPLLPQALAVDAQTPISVHSPKPSSPHSQSTSKQPKQTLGTPTRTKTSRPRANSNTVNSTPLSPTPAKPGSSHRRRALSLTAKLRRQPPIPFPISRASSVQLPPIYAHSTNSSVSVADSHSEKCKEKGVLRRLSGWMKSTEGRVAGQARRVKRQLSVGSQESDELEDWTFLDSVVPADADIGATQNMWALPPSMPLPPVPNTTPILPNTLAQTILTEQEIEDGFAFDGLADLEREQAKIDARHPDKMHARCTSLLERIDALHLIANTIDNSRNGMTQTTVRRISSELGINTRTSHNRRSITLDQKALSDMAQNIPHAQARRLSVAMTQSPARITKPKIASQKLGLNVDASTTLTPQATRRGGILKPGRSQRRRAGETRTIRVVTPSYAVNRGSEHTVPVSPSSSCASIARQVRSARVPRKQVRFPEEQRLLESIRLIDPRTAQCIESRSTSADSLPSVQDASSSISSLQGSESITSLQGSESVSSLQGSESISSILEPDTLSSVFDSVQPRYTRPPISRLVHGDTARLPVPWSLQSDKVVRSKGGVIFDHAALSPTLAAMGQQYTASQVTMDTQYTTNSSGMEVGPNISSTQSSPAPTRTSSKCPSASPSPPSS
ncbi:hypothetical protein GGH96_003070 [Coemansia sp. RSA 1972]|nr:hypothetical protein GGH96_003070 [Coemansia sp. RSA 1972]